MALQGTVHALIDRNDSHPFVRLAGLARLRLNRWGYFIPDFPDPNFPDEGALCGQIFSFPCSPLSRR